MIFPRGGLFIGNLNDVASRYEIKLSIYEKFMKKNKMYTK